MTYRTFTLGDFFYVAVTNDTTTMTFEFDCFEAQNKFVVALQNCEDVE